jgi:hypothetical protein
MMIETRTEMVRQTVRETATKIKNDTPYRVQFILASCFALILFFFILFEIIKIGISFAHPKYALEFPGWLDSNEREQLPQISICPGLNHTNGQPTVPATIDTVSCTFIDIKPVDPHDPSKGKIEQYTDLLTERATQYVSFRELNCINANYDPTISPWVYRHNSHSYVTCRVKTSGHYIKVTPYPQFVDKPSNNWAYWVNIRTGQSVQLGIAVNEYGLANGDTKMYYDIEKVATELRFAPSSTSHNIVFTMSFVQLSKTRYQQFYLADVLVTFGTIGGMFVFFIFIYKGLSKLFHDSFKDVAPERVTLVSSESRGDYGGL